MVISFIYKLPGKVAISLGRKKVREKENFDPVCGISRTWKGLRKKNRESLSLGIETGLPKGDKELKFSRGLLIVVELQEAPFPKHLKKCIDKAVFNTMISYWRKWGESKTVIHLERQSELSFWAHSYW